MYQNNRYQTKPKTKVLTTPKGLFGLMAVISAVIILGVWLVVRNNFSDKGQKTTSSKQIGAFGKTQHSLTDPYSPWVVVNKLRSLSPIKFTPSDLTTPSMAVESDELKVNAQTASALTNMASAAAGEGVNLIVLSGFRSYYSQRVIYDSEVRGYGQEQADRESARPGYSEHQTGWAADLGAKNGKCRIEACFADTAEGKWLAANSYKYGFIIRYPNGKESVTGYQNEPWHVRYVGVDLATEMHRLGIKTLEEFFGLGSAPNY